MSQAQSVKNEATPLVHRHFKIYKPYTCLSQFKPENRRTKMVLGDLTDFPAGTMAIGRLDKDSEGLLLLTTDGKVSERVRSKSVEKEYWVQLDGDIDAVAMAKLQNGVEIGVDGGKYLTLPCKAYKIEGEPDLPAPARKPRDLRHGPLSWASITISEGKNRQIRKMTAAVGFPTLRLVRVRIGDIRIDAMQPGDVIELEHAPHN
ncbi:pseudouridine synthase [Ferrimonas pelagia]